MWGGVATVTNTTSPDLEDRFSPTGELDTDWPAAYIVRLTATDNLAQEGSADMIVTVAANTCLAAQLSTPWTGFNTYDLDTNCVVDLKDFYLFASEWIDNRHLMVQE